MKFLCGNCKAKYQIADAKVAGRTLRMKCRRCGHDILIHGEHEGSAAGRVAGSTVSMPPAPGRGSGGASRSQPPPPPVPPSALGAGFRRGIAGPPEVPSRKVEDQWHVAIHDVPVGPMSREELARKIAASAVGPGSLCWREGMDDWRPVRDVPELSMLLTRPAGSAGSRPPGRRSAAPPDDFDDDFGEPTRVADPSQLHRGGSSASALPAVGSGMASSPSAAAPAPSRPQMSPYALIGIGMAIAMGLLGGPVIVMQLLESNAKPAAQAASAPGSQEPRQASVEVELPDDPAHADPEDPAEAEEPEVEAAAPPKKSGTKPSGAARPTGPKRAAGKQLSDEERKLLERMGGGSDAVPGKLGASSNSNRGGGGGGPALTAAQLRSVVTKNRPGLQRCYESALRATGSTDTVKINVALTVGMSGTVTKVNATGNGLGDLNRCIERTVRRWRFPSSSDSSQLAFPVVFQPGS